MIDVTLHDRLTRKTREGGTPTEFVASSTGNHFFSSNININVATKISSVFTNISGDTGRVQCVFLPFHLEVEFSLLIAQTRVASPYVGVPFVIIFLSSAMTDHLNKDA